MPDPKQRIIESNNYNTFIKELDKALADGYYVQQIRDWKVPAIGGPETRWFAVVEEPFSYD